MKVQGIAASPGIAIGEVMRLQKIKHEFRRSVAAGEVAQEKARFSAAKEVAMADLEELKKRTAANFGQEKAEVFGAHQMMLEDPMFNDAVLEAIDARHASAEAAVEEAAEAIAGMLAALDDAYMRERAADIKDIGQRLIRILQGSAESAKLTGIVVAQDLLPSDTAALDLEVVTGFITALGGKTSHSSILARAAGIPAVVGVGQAWEDLQNGDTVIVDGHAGLVLVNPGDGELAEYRERKALEQAKAAEIASAAKLEGMTADGWRVEVAANIGIPRDMEKAAAAGAEGVGLFRTEFLFQERQAVPTEEEQTEAYSAVLRAMPDRKIVIRTLDAGGDKQLPFLGTLAEANPALGFRAIRLCLTYRDVFKTQLRALLRAGTEGNLHIMFPMIATLEELLSAKALLREAAEELAGEGVAHRADVPVGIMVEVPAAVAIADILVQEVDFFSIGTNDLVQYTMACDRMNEHVAYLNDYFHPAVVRLIAEASRAAQAGGKWIGMCGEMAGDPLAAPLLVGLGLTELSMNTRSVPQVKDCLRRLTLAQAKAWAGEILTLRTAGEIKGRLEAIAAELAGR
ncbi:MAG TPA: phosphoenolpyruvate--protein phosphotransferase [Selenomonadales bacterium]|nr:phosphoenolpyruvate--protein phosphotransferase [Selenomonadales bacterium]